MPGKSEAEKKLAAIAASNRLPPGHLDAILQQADEFIEEVIRGELAANRAWSTDRLTREDRDALRAITTPTKPD